MRSTQRITHTLLQRDPKTRHTRIRHRDEALLALLLKEWNDAATAAHDVAVTHATEAGRSGAGIRVALDEQFFRTELGRAIKVDGIHGLVRTEGQHPRHLLIDRRVDDVFCPHDVGEHRFEGIIFTSRHLFKGSGVHDDIHAMKGPLQPLAISHVAQEEAQRRAGRFRVKLPQLVLLQFVSAENDQLLGPIFAQEDLRELSAKGACAAGDQYGLLLPVHSSDVGKNEQGRHINSLFFPP
jgi:hypothetical protein